MFALTQWGSPSDEQQALLRVGLKPLLIYSSRDEHLSAIAAARAAEAAEEAAVAAAARAAIVACKAHARTSYHQEIFTLHNLFRAGNLGFCRVFQRFLARLDVGRVPRRLHRGVHPLLLLLAALRLRNVCARAAALG